MIDYQQFCRIKLLHEQEGLKIPGIAADMQLDQRTVAYWLGQSHFRQRKTTAKSTILDPFKPEIARLLARHPYSAVQIFQQIRENGYEGSYNTVKRYVRKIKPKRAAAFLKLHFAPGECGQVDWGSFGTVKVGETSRRLSFFVMALGYSRMLYVECTVSQTMEHWLACHQHAFEFFGGVPARIMIDNLKSAVLKRVIGQAPQFNPHYLDFANHYGFAISACNVRAGNEKGIVERGVGYVKKNLLTGLEIADFRHLPPVCRQWLDQIANVRIHGETKKRPVDLFAEERPSLQPLPVHPPDIGAISQVRASSQFRVTLDTNRYSVPAEYAGERLTLKVYPDRLCCYHRDQLIARHDRCYDRHQDIEDPDHPKPLLAQRRKAKDQQVLKRFLALSPRAGEYYRALAAKRLNPLHHSRRIVALSEIYSPEAVAAAMEDAFTFQAFSAEYIANILEQRARFAKKPGALHLTRRQDLLDLEIEPPDMNLYQIKEE